MSLFGPQPRFHLYTTPRAYLAVLRDIVLRRVNAGEGGSRLEDEMRRSLGASFALCMPMARVGIYLTVKALIKPGQRVILSPCTIPDVINMVLCAGGRPVFADVERQTCNIDPAEVERLLDAEVGAVLITHLNGLACDVDRIAATCKAHGVPLIEDAAQAFGACVSGRPVGTFGDAGFYSFGLWKPVTSFLGGMVVTPRQDLYDRIRAEVEGYCPQDMGRYLRYLLQAARIDLATARLFFGPLIYRAVRFGHLHHVGFINRLVVPAPEPSPKEEVPPEYLRRMTPMQARLILSGLPGAQAAIAARVRRARAYHEGLSGLPNLILPPMRTDGSHIYNHYPIQTPLRAALIDHLMRRGRDVVCHPLVSCADLPAFKSHFRDCPQAHAIVDEAVLLPMYPSYSEAEVGKTINVIRDFFGAVRPARREIAPGAGVGSNGAARPLASGAHLPD